MSRPGHKRVNQGKCVMIYFMDGRREVDHFYQAKGNALEFRRLGRIPKGQIKTLTILKGGNHAESSQGR